MGLFDRFRNQPKWKHADAAVRVAGVEELPLEEQTLLAELARGDSDSRVRRAAVRKIYDPALLAQVSRDDGDAGVREEAGRILIDLAVGAFEDSSEAESLKALEQVKDPKDLTSIAKTASAEAVSLAALARLSDTKLIASIARRAAHASVRTEALARVDDIDELSAIAVKADHRDVAVAATERITDAGRLRTIASKSAHKAAARSAKSKLGDIDAQERAKAAELEAASRVPEWDVERDRQCRAVEEAASGTDWRDIESRMSAAEARWNALATEAGTPADEARTKRFLAACERAREAQTRLRQQEAERAQVVEQAGREQAERTTICDTVDAIAVSARAADADTEQLLARVRSAREQWSGVQTPHLSPREVENFDRRFEQASRVAEREIERAKQARANRGRMAEIARQAEELAASVPSRDHRPIWAALRQEWKELGGAGVAGEETAARFEAASNAAHEREAQAREREHKRQREELEKLQQLCTQVETVAKAETLTLKEGERALRDIKKALDEAGGGPKKQERAEVIARLHDIQAVLFPRVAELRETDEWARWANVGIQEQLCQRAEALLQVPDATEAMRQLRELQQQWKQAAAAPRDKAQQLWERFKKVGDEIHAKASAHFAQQTAEREQNLARKQEIVKKAEALAESTDWIATAEAIKQLQAEWTSLGPVPKGNEKPVWESFRAACDRFFTRRREDLTRRKEEWAANLARKEALIARVEELLSSTDRRAAADEIKRMQAEWKTVGPVRKNRSEELWKRFRAACDAFFNAGRQQGQPPAASAAEELDATAVAAASLAEQRSEPASQEEEAVTAPPETMLAARLREALEAAEKRKR